MKVDAEGTARLGLAPGSLIGARQAECGFDVWVHDDGLWCEGPDGFRDEKQPPYSEYVVACGYEIGNLRADFANAGVDDARKASGTGK